MRQNEYLWSKGLSKKIPVKNKTAKSVLEAMKLIFKDVKAMKILAEKGSEFANQCCRKLINSLPHNPDY